MAVVYHGGQKSAIPGTFNCLKFAAYSRFFGTLDKRWPMVTLPPEFPSNENEERRIAMKIRPLHDRILVKRLAEQDRTAGGLYIPDTAKEKPIEAQVVAVGTGKIMEDGSVRKLEVKTGDKVLFAKYSGSEVKIDGEEHLILREEDLLAVID